MNVHFAVLALLAGGPRPVRRLRAELAGGPGGLLPGSVDQVSPALDRLVRTGLAETSPLGAADDPQPTFRITRRGQQELAGWLRTPTDSAAAPGGELALKILLAVRVPGTDVHEVIQAHRRRLIESMRQCIQLRQRGAGQDLNQALAGYAELFRLDAVVRWLDTADSLVGWVSDGDRDLAAAQLRENFAVGRLTRAELDERLTVALTAQTAGDLRGLLADLPGA